MARPQVQVVLVHRDRDGHGDGKLVVTDARGAGRTRAVPAGRARCRPDARGAGRARAVPAGRALVV